MARRKTKYGRVLDKIRRTPGGMTFVEIQKFVVRMNGLNWGDKVEKSRYSKKTVEYSRKYLAPRYRGYWCTNLRYQGKGLLDDFCEKVDGRWTISALYSRGTYVSIRPRPWDGSIRILRVWRKHGSRT